MKTATTIILNLIILIGISQGNDKPTLAILQLQMNASENSNALALTDKVRAIMFKMNRYTIVEREEMESILKEQGFQQTGCVSSKCAIEAGQLLGVSQILAGSVNKIGNNYSISLRIIDVRTGQNICNTDIECPGSIENIFRSGLSQAIESLFKATTVNILPNDSTVIWYRSGLKWGLETKTGAMVTRAKFSRVKPFSHGVALVNIEGKWGYVNTNGEMVIPARYSIIKPFSCGLAPVKIDRNWGYINASGELVIEAKYCVAKAFANGIAEVATCNPYVKYLIDTSGKIIKQLPL